MTMNKYGRFTAVSHKRLKHGQHNVIRHVGHQHSHEQDATTVTAATMPCPVGCHTSLLWGLHFLENVRNKRTKQKQKD